MSKKMRGISKCPSELQSVIDEANSLPQLWDEEVEKYIEEEIDKKNTTPPFYPAQETYLYDCLFNGNFFYDLVHTATTPEEKKKREQERFRQIVSELPAEFVKLNEWIADIINGKTVTLDVSLKKSKEKAFRTAFDYFESEYRRGVWMELNIRPDGTMHYSTPLSRLLGDLRQAVTARENLIEVIGWNKRYGKSWKSQIPASHKLLVFTLENGELDVGILSGNLELMKNLKVDTRRIGKCPTCRKIFWKQRENATTCSRKCANAYHQERITENPKKRAIVNARRSKTRFDERVKALRNRLVTAKNVYEKNEIEKQLQQAINKRQNAAIKLQNLQKEIKEGENKNGTL